MGDIFPASFDVARGDIVFEVCVFDAYSSLETCVTGKKNNDTKQKKKEEKNCRVVDRNYIWLSGQ